MKKNNKDKKEDDRKSRILAADIDKDEKKKRKSIGLSKSEMRDKLEGLEKVPEFTFTKDQIGVVSKGLFQMVEGMSQLPFTQVNPELKEGWDESVALCLNTYGGANLAKWAPLFQLGTLSMLIVHDALEKKRAEIKEKKKPKDVSDQVDTTLND